jgi:hypothetical protein
MFIRKLLLGAALAALALPAVAGAHRVQSAWFEATLHGKQVSGWNLDRSDTVGDCTVESVGSGREDLQFETVGKPFVKITSDSHGLLEIYAGTAYRGLFSTEADVTRDSSMKIFPSPRCGELGPTNVAPGTPDCGSHHVDRYLVGIEPVEGAKTWVGLWEGSNPDIYLNCYMPGAAYPELLDKYGYLTGEPIAVQLRRDQLFNPKVKRIVARAGGDYHGQINGADVGTSLRWSLTLERLP